MWIADNMLTSLTDSGRRSTFMWSPSSKPSGTLFCIRRGMDKFRFLSDSDPFCHWSSCLRESTSRTWRDGEVLLKLTMLSLQTVTYISHIQTFNKFLNSLRNHRVITFTRRSLRLLFILIVSRRSSMVRFVPAVLLDQRDDELFWLLCWFGTERKTDVKTC